MSSHWMCENILEIWTCIWILIEIKWTQNQFWNTKNIHWKSWFRLVWVGPKSYQKMESKSTVEWAVKLNHKLNICHKYLLESIKYIWILIIELILEIMQTKKVSAETVKKRKTFGSWVSPHEGFNALTQSHNKYCSLLTFNQIKIVVVEYA